MSEAPMPYWHAVNPWRDSIVYVPIERLAECAAGGMIRLQDGTIVPHDARFLLRHWRQCGRTMLDAYILPQPDGFHSLGVRYGAAGSEYFSPCNQQRSLTAALLEEYSK